MPKVNKIEKQEDIFFPLRNQDCATTETTQAVVNKTWIHLRFHVKIEKLWHSAALFFVILVLALKLLEEFQVRTTVGQR